VIRVLVTGAGGSAGINFVECLRLADEPFHVVGGDINLWHLELPDVDAAVLLPRCTSPDYVDALNAILEDERIDVLHAQPDMELEVISAHRDRIRARLFLPEHDVIMSCHDKMRTNELLQAAGVPVPEAHRVHKLSEIGDILDRLHRRSPVAWLRAIKGAGSKAALPVRSCRHAREWIHYWRSTGRLETDDFMISELLPGREFAFQSLWHAGGIVTSQARERLEYVFGNLTPSGQSSSPAVARTVHRADVNEIASRAIRAVDPSPSGVYCVDLKENADGVPCVTEINIGRFFTTSNFFARAGCNMPYHYVRIAVGDPPPELPAYDALPEGLYWIRLIDKGPVLVREGEFRASAVAAAVRAPGS
jgi:carbamoyl-phosphate synthase large subunit